MPGALRSHLTEAELERLLAPVRMGKARALVVCKAAEWPSIAPALEAAGVAGRREGIWQRALDRLRGEPADLLLATEAALGSGRDVFLRRARHAPGTPAVLLALFGEAPATADGYVSLPVSGADIARWLPRRP